MTAMTVPLAQNPLPQGLEVTFEGVPGRIDLAAYVDMLTQLRLALLELDRRLRPTGAGAARWGVQHLPFDGGLRTLINPVGLPKRRSAKDLQEPPLALVRGVEELIERPGLPPAFTPTVIDRLQKIGEHVGASGIEQVLIADVNGRQHEPMPINPSVLENAGAAVKEVTRAHGSVEGVLDLLSARGGRLRASVYDARTRRAVTVYFSDDLTALVQENFDRQVIAEGVLSRNALGQPVTLRLSHLEPRPADEPVAVDALVGIVPNWLGGQTTEDYLDVARRRA